VYYKKHYLIAIIGCGARRRAVCVLFRTRLRAGLRVVRARRAHCFVCRQRVMSRVSARRLHAVVLFRASFARYVARVVRKLACCFAHRKLTSLRISRANYISYLFDSC
jgi:hypothetical protein